MADPPDPLQYDSIAAGYADHAEDGPYNALYDRPAILELLGDVAQKRVLDAGCGPGLLAAELVARGADVVGCDAAPSMIELARGRLGDDAEFLVHDLEEPFHWVVDEQFDLAVMALVLHHITNRVDALREIWRGLRPEGALVVSTHHPTADWTNLGGSYFAFEPVTIRWSKGWDITAWRMPLHEMCREFTDAGFVIERLVEPRPVAEMEASHPDDYALLTTEPDFIAFRLRKRWP